MDIFSVTIYGFIQGLTEFLPVSSSGHLALLPKFLSIKDPGVTFDLAMHIGTALAVMIYFRHEVKGLVSGTIDLLARREGPKKSHAANFLISTVFSFVVILILKKFAGRYGRDESIIAYNLIGFGVLLFVSDHFFKNDRQNIMENKVALIPAILIGIFQSLAIFPGVSRSGITITTARFLGLSRDESSRYSFLLSLPIIWAGFLYKLPEVIKGNDSFNLFSVILGILISFSFGILTIHYFLKFIKKFSLVHFMLYRVLLGLILLFS